MTTSTKAPALTDMDLDTVAGGGEHKDWIFTETMGSPLRNTGDYNGDGTVDAQDFNIWH